MLPDLKDLELSTLYDLLADYTSKYTPYDEVGRRTWGFHECRDSILQLQNEIDYRKTEVDIQENKDLDNGLELVPVIAWWARAVFGEFSQV